MKSKDKIRCIKIFQHYGPKSQFEKTIEELEELLIEVQAHNDKFSFNHKKLIDELADVSIMIEQLSYAVGHSKVEDQISDKIDRQFQRILEGE